MNMRLPLRTATCVTVLLAFAASSTAQANDSVMYRLNDATDWSQGCFDGLCLCPIQLNPDVRGTATLGKPVVFGTTLVYDVTDVNWRVGQGPFEMTLTGSGTYTRISGFAGWLHQLELDLSVDGASPIPFDSGLVNGGGNFPDITISIQNGIDWDADCVFGTIINVDTSPVPSSQMGCYMADFDHDLKVGFTDMTSMLNSWGDCEGCLQDLSGNGRVDFEDLTDLLVAWGTCP